MNFIAASLLYHCDEVSAFWILNFILNDLNMNEIYQVGMNGFLNHLKIFEEFILKWDYELYDLVVSKWEGYSIIEIAF